MKLVSLLSSLSIHHICKYLRFCLWLDISEAKKEATCAYIYMGNVWKNVHELLRLAPGNDMDRGHPMGKESDPFDY